MIERHGGIASQPTTTRRTSIATLIWLQKRDPRFLDRVFLIILIGDCIKVMDLYKEFYNKEIERKEQLTAKSQYLISISIVLVGSFLYLLKNSNYFDDKFNFLLFFLHIHTTIALCYSIYQICRSLAGNKYAYIPSPLEIDKYDAKLKCVYKDFPKEYELQWSIFLKESYIKTTEYNINANNKKNNFIVKGSVALIISFLFISLSFLFIIPNHFNAENPVQKIEIVNCNDH